MHTAEEHSCGGKNNHVTSESVEIYVRPMKSFVSADVWVKMGENLINLVSDHEKHDVRFTLQLIFT